MDIVRDDPVVQRFCTAPGIGPVTAVAFVSTLDQVERFGGLARSLRVSHVSNA